MARVKLGRKGWIAVGAGAALALVIGVSATAAAHRSGPDDAEQTYKAVASFSDDTGPSASPTPVVETATVTATEPVPFAEKTVEDANRDAGTSTVTTAGVAGVRTKTYRVTTTDGVETARELISDTVTTAPVDQVTTVGTRQAPVEAPAPQAPAAQAPASCDPNYSGACVPIASDVDCAGGSGNGPAYVAGPVRVVGQDIYDLDRDGDGVACE
ncbi:G5 domain-containing protein [Leifsonia sp. NPDC080035]|uniref:G5 domain-containing protein n=1 Tax=Leifsonia sp. NPDC080035 TaxID=3143936 RepID=A0AAU7GC17_9MICO